jgi:hypothetical protein
VIDPQESNMPIALNIAAAIAALALAGSAGAGEGRTIEVAGNDGAAIAAAIAAASPGDTVRLPAGSFTIAEAIRPKSGIHVIGAGQDKTVIRYRGEKQGALVTLDGVEDVELAGMTLDGEGNALVRTGIAGHDSRRLLVREVTVRNLAKGSTFGPHGIYWCGVNPTKEKGVVDSAIRDCTFEDIGVGAEYGSAVRLAWGSSRNVVEGCTIRRTGRGGIFGDSGATDLVIRRNRVEGSGGEGLGIEVWGGCDRSVIEDNHVDHWLSIGGSDRCAVRRNLISDSLGVVKFIGIEVIGSDCVVTDNKVGDGQAIGISVSGETRKQNVYYSRNEVGRSVQWGAQLQGERSGLARHYFHACRFADGTLGRGKPIYPGDEGHGFRVNDGARGLTFEDCEFTGNGRLGVQFLGARVDAVEFIRCRIAGNGGGAMAGLVPAATFEWSGGRVEANGKDDLPPARPFARPAPTVDFTVPEPLRAGRPAAFRSAVRTAGGEPRALLWDLGDGPPETAAEVTHAYARPGRYRVTLVTWDDGDRGARREKTVEVTADVPAGE